MNSKSNLIAARQIAMAALIAISLFALLQQSNLGALFTISRGEGTWTARDLDRVSCIAGSIPPEVTELGFLPALPMRMEDPHISRSMIRQNSDAYRALYLSQFALAPRLIAYNDQAEWIVAHYPDHASGLAGIAGKPYQVVKDCSNGVFLLRR